MPATAGSRKSFIERYACHRCAEAAAQGKTQIDSARKPGVPILDQVRLERQIGSLLDKNRSYLLVLFQNSS